MAPSMQRYRPANVRLVPRQPFATAAEVAQLAGARDSRSTVSRTFTPGASVSTDICNHLTGAADRLGYRVNRLAQGLISARSNLVGILGSTIEMPYHASLVSSLSQALLA